MPPKRRATDMDDDSDDEIPSFGRQILPVAALPGDFDGEPTDGLQYLFTVRREFNRLPHVTRVANPYELPPTPAPVPQTEGTARPSRLPSAGWRASFEQHFRNFRKNIPQAVEPGGWSSGPKVLPDMRDRDKWWQFLRGAPESVWNPPKRPKVDKERRRQHGRDRPHEDVLGPWTPVNPAPYSSQIVKEEPVTYEGDWQPEAPHGYGRAAFTVPDSYSVANNREAAAGPSIVKTEQAVSTRYIPPRPTPILLKEIDSRYALHILMYFAYWINLYLEHLEDPAADPEPSPDPIATHHLSWVFALLARVEDTPTADDTAQLRSLARGCVGLIKVRQPVSSGTSEAGEVPETTSDEYVAGCWMVLAAVAGVWVQHDLWQDAHVSLN